MDDYSKWFAMYAVSKGSIETHCNLLEIKWHMLHAATV